MSESPAPTEPDTSKGDDLADPSSPLPPLWRSLGLRDPSALTDEADAPPVDPEVLAGLAAGRLGPAESEHARLLLARFRTWRDAYARMLSQPAEHSPPAEGAGTNAQASVEKKDEPTGQP